MSDKASMDNLPTSMNDDWENADETTSFCHDDGERMDVFAPSPSPERLTVRRQLYTQEALDKQYPDRAPHPSACDVIRSTCRVSPKCLGEHALSFFPILSTVKNYDWRHYVVPDVVGGLSAGFIHLPQGLGFGILASLQPVNGLYTTFFPIVVYLLFGTSPHVSMGTNALIALLTANLVEREADGLLSKLGPNVTVTDEELMAFKVSVSAASCLVGGAVLAGMGLLRLGFVTNYLSKSFIGGFTFAAAVHITTSQIVKMLHLKLPARSGLGKLVVTYIDIFTNITLSNPADIVVGLVCIVILLAVKIGINERYKHKMKAPVPIELIVVIVATLISHYVELNDRFNVAVVGSVPTGMPMPSLPVPPPIASLASKGSSSSYLSVADHLANVADEGFVTAILIFALTISLGKLTAKLHDIHLDDNQELVAYGLCQLVGAFFQNFPSCTAPPRTMLLSSLGSKTTLNGITSAAFILLVLLAAGPLFVSLPIAMLAAMIIAAMKDLLLQIRNIKSLWHINKADFFIWVVTALVSIFGDLDFGLLVGVIFSMVTVMAVSQLAKGTLLGTSSNEDVVADLGRKGIRPVPGIKIFRFESALYFVSQERFRRQLFSLVQPVQRIKKHSLEISEPDSNGSVDVEIPALDHDRRVSKWSAKASPHRTSLHPKSSNVDALPRVSFSANPRVSFSDKGGRRHLHTDSAVDSATEKPPSTARKSIAEMSTTDKPSSEKSITIATITTAAGGTAANNGGGKDDFPSQDNEGLHLEECDDVVQELDNEPLQHVILDCSAMTYIDVTGVDTLQAAMGKLSLAGVEAWLAGVTPPTLATLGRAGFLDKVGRDRIFYSVHDALQHLRPPAQSPVAEEHISVRL